MEEFESVSGMPSCLFHYTTTKSFVEIVNKECLWLSNAMYLNDKYEINFGINLLRSISKNWTDKYNISKIIYEIEDNINREVYPEIYVASFCEHNDLLSQWRGYTGSSGGICIGFKSLEILRLSRFNLGDLSRVHYGDNDGKNRAEDYIYRQYTREERAKKVTGERYNKFIKSKISKTVFNLIANLKHESFREEKEWRISIPGVKINDNDKKFREKNGVLIPYYELKFKPEDAIERISIGPGENQDLIAKSVKNFLTMKKLNFTVEKSTIPFRP